ncbi:MAG: hypothetical protein ACI95X_003201, partial [Paraglaciecola sp.]
LLCSKPLPTEPPASARHVVITSVDAVINIG